MPYNSEDVKTVVVNKATSAAVAIVPHPGTGKRLAIDRIFLGATGGAVVATLTGAIVLPISLASLEKLNLSNSEHDPMGIFKLNADQGLTLALGGNVQVDGFINYRIING